MPYFPPASSGSGAPTDATYITQTTNGTLSAEQALSALGTGLVKNTTGTGILSIGVAGTDFSAVSHSHVAADLPNDFDLLADLTLGSAGVSLSSGTIAARQCLVIYGYIEGYAGSDTASLQFNAAAGTAYRYRWLTSAAAATTFTAGLVAASTDRIKIGAANTTTTRIFSCFISNDASVTEKLVIFSTGTFGTGSAATQATLQMGNGAWVSGASTQITRVDLVSTSNMLAGTRMWVFGSRT